MGTMNIQSITAAFALIFFVPLASSFQLCVNFNQFSSEMVTKADEWAAARVQTSCALGFGADNDYDPMSDEQRLELARMYRGKPITQTASWQVFTGEFTKVQNWQNMKQVFLERNGVSAANIFFYDEEQLESTLTVAQLNLIQARNFGPVLINLRGFGKTPADMESIKASIRHPMTKACIIEGTPRAFNLLSTPTRIIVAKYVLSQGKTVYLMAPPVGPNNPVLDVPYIESVRAMINDVRTGLGDAAMNSNRVVIVLASYSLTVTNLPFFPMLTPSGEPADSFTGALLLASQMKNTLLDNGIAQAVCYDPRLGRGSSGIMSPGGICTRALYDFSAL